MSRLTLHEARTRISSLSARANLPAERINWHVPRKEARMIWLALLSIPEEQREAARQIAIALDAYADHLVFEDGRRFERAAVERASNEVGSLEGFRSMLAGGYHHAEEMAVTAGGE